MKNPNSKTGPLWMIVINRAHKKVNIYLPQLRYRQENSHKNNYSPVEASFEQNMEFLYCRLL